MNTWYSRHSILDGYVLVIFPCCCFKSIIWIDISCFVGLGRWEIRVAYCVSCGAGDDQLLASGCCIYQWHKSTSGNSACGRTSVFFFECERV